MGEHIYKLKIGEITHIRVTCKDCGTVVEIDVSRAGKLPSDCPACSQILFHDKRVLIQLQNALCDLAQHDDAVVEFPLKLAPSVR